MATLADKLPAQPDAEEWNPDIPDPVLQQVDSPYPFAMQSFDRMGIGRKFYDVIVLKGCFDFSADGLTMTPRQPKLIWSDAYWDDDNPEISSLKAAADFELYKPSSDVLVTGSVKSLDGKLRKEWAGMLRVVRANKEILIQKTLRFTGPRWWKHGLVNGWTLSQAQLTTQVPLRYELAYGGYWINPKQDPDSDLARQVYDSNPSGSGHFGKSHDTAQAYLGPQIELHPQAITVSNRDYTAAGFGPIARFWQPRVKWAGAHDAAWEKQFHDSGRNNQLPDYAPDFDYRHFQAAPPDQITSEYLRGDETIELAGLFEDVPAMAWQLPEITFNSDLFTADGKTLHNPMKLDTLHIDLDTRQANLTWRLTLAQSDGITHARLRLAEPATPLKDKK